MRSAPTNKPAWLIEDNDGGANIGGEKNMSEGPKDKVDMCKCIHILHTIYMKICKYKYTGSTCNHWRAMSEMRKPRNALLHYAGFYTYIVFIQYIYSYHILMSFKLCIQCAASKCRWRINCILRVSKHKMWEQIFGQ